MSCMFLCDFHRSHSDDDDKGCLLLIIENVPGIGLHELLMLSPLNLRAWRFDYSHVTHVEKSGIGFVTELRKDSKMCAQTVSKTGL